MPTFRDSGERTNLMKKTFCFTCLLVLVMGASVCFADMMIPNLVGTWTVKAEGGVMLRGADQGPNTHHKGPFSALEAEAVITKQQGRVLHGVFKSPRATENFVAVIGHDNETLYYADQDGFLEGTIEDKDTIQVIYRHVSPNDVVVAVGIWTRNK
jgi:hypothetical protein